MQGDRHRRPTPLGAGWLLALVIAGAPRPGTASETRVSFLEPVDGDLITGITPIVLEIDTPDAVAVSQVTLRIDGETVHRWTEPPFELTWDAGPEVLARRIEAVAIDSTGRTVTATITTRALVIHQQELVDLVDLYVTVIDGAGDFIDGLGREEFTVVDDGRVVPITHFAAEPGPVSLVLLLDCSLSMEGRPIETARRAAARFVQALDEQDRAIVSCFNSEVTRLTPLTADRDQLVAAIDRTTAKGGTALYDALVDSTEALLGTEGRRAVILLSDGRDEAADATSPGSLYTFQEALKAALEREVIVYPIGLGRNVDEVDFYGRRRVRELLQQLAWETGGRAYFVQRPGELRGTYQRIARELQHQYSLGFPQASDARRGRWRVLTVEVEGGPYRIFTRRGYYPR